MCDKIVRAVLEEYAGIEPAPRRLTGVRVVVGGMHQVVPEYLEFAYQVLTKETAAEGSALDVALTPVVGQCRDCRWRGELALPFFQCGSCQGRNIEVVSGMEMYLDKLEIEEFEHQRDSGL